MKRSARTEAHREAMATLAYALVPVGASAAIVTLFVVLAPYVGTLPAVLFAGFVFVGGLYWQTYREARRRLEEQSDG